MTSSQLSSRFAGTTQPVFCNHIRVRLKRFIGNRLREAGYGTFFASVFLICQSPANALALDDIRVLSKLGEPLIAEVVVSPAAGEVLNRSCFSAIPSTGDLPDVGRVRLTLTRTINSNVLNVAGTQPIREPMTEFMLQVKCPGVPTLIKNFLVMVDPPALEDAAMTPASAPVTATSQPRRAARRPSSSTSGPQTLQPGSRYTVQPGDMLSTIASRVSGRPEWSVWPIAQQIYKTNPGAFLLGDPNVIAQGSVIFIPRLADVDMSASASATVGAIGTAAASSLPAAANAPAPTVAAAPVTRKAPPTVATTATMAAAVVTNPAQGVARILPTPATVAPAITLPAMQLTTRLLSESRIKVMLRAQGSPVAPAVVRSPAATEVPASSTPEPQSQPDRPDIAVTDTRAAMQADQPNQTDVRLGWFWVVVGLLVGLLMGALAAVGLFRRNLRLEYEHDVREGVHRQVNTDRLRTQREQMQTNSDDTGATPGAAAATMDLSRTVKMPAPTDHTVEMTKVDALEFESPARGKTVKAAHPETVVMPAIANDLDLELPVDTGRTGQQEVDFDLLEAAYSVDYQSEFLSPVGTADDLANDDADGETGDTRRYYHLENRDPSGETPLPIELGDDEMGNDDSGDGDSKVVRFRR